MSEPDPTCPDFSRLRHEYSSRSLSERDVNANPITQFTLWLNDAISAGALEPNAMTLATSTREGAPSARSVLLKGVDANGLSFFTNYRSPKARDLDSNPRAALLFFWPELERQVRIEGSVIRTSAAESDAYFASRPSASRLASAASPQSEPVESRTALERMFDDLALKYPDGNVPRPAHWGGYRVTPTRFEFWQGGANRMHDRIEYTREGPTWRIRRLAP